ncbi:hypothetical protein [Cohaesibacter sp. ES.047]|uniref:hypothetical protein n=1 Tax=Cohaesibacter sp. ES.047 TaxID=1798205 RepID=UPI000BB68508|nr:hypothetical protein [Cohaesibacter sp. ES.047]
MNDYSGALNVGLNLLGVVIWAVYLHVFWRSYIRNTRTELHIDVAAAKGHSARCLVTNMGSDMIYIEDVIADIEINDEIYSAIVADREEMDEDINETPLSRTNRGPLKGGCFLDLGSLRQLAERVHLQTGSEDNLTDFQSIKIAVIGLSSQSNRVIRAEKQFNADWVDGRLTINAPSVETKQVKMKRYAFNRRRLGIHRDKWGEHKGDSKYRKVWRA